MYSLFESEDMDLKVKRESVSIFKPQENYEQGQHYSGLVLSSMSRNNEAGKNITSGLCLMDRLQVASTYAEKDRSFSEPSSICLDRLLQDISQPCSRRSFETAEKLPPHTFSLVEFIWPSDRMQDRLGATRETSML